MTVKPSREDLLACLRIERWAAAMAELEFDSMLEMERAAVSIATPLTEAEIDEALAAHPRIGDRAKGEGVEARFSAAEQKASQSPDEALAARLADLNAQYEERFGRVFLIRAAGRSREEVVAELERRLGNDDHAELAEIADQLRGIALLRLRATYEEALA
ncbi:2-oxo-4-hydroxy-4-carboxy-5-ureidoimidazoline decarboxylase [Demequina zhanjiangensis]|uniref:2-oxo-4-hydroxy-4-carboxy-5-ureidoimidazoline decarboxylase n=1 Tax=Demequina zhanjiangensis TaxID=3051659 RepID=A0ABT8FZE2_9MICO|nr:2-oxo-4-hydroxy-4-carboxy-5-ureidoimidazoline decarboxylase [Demequina sp. SYSU T00b26]MDN4471829.1 2-oxo-4-hydroxy-4-carboxy-5-ureidoimidazoline decarboxylase [Demequina sp. SYSU T00b26]